MYQTEHSTFSAFDTDTYSTIDTIPVHFSCIDSKVGFGDKLRMPCWGQSLLLSAKIYTVQLTCNVELHS